MATETRGDEFSPGDDDATLAGEEWPVAEHYRVTPASMELGEDATAAERTVMLEQAPEPAARRVRRFPPDVGPGALVALIAALILIPGAIWLAANELDDPSSAPAASGTVLQSTSTTPARETSPRPPETTPLPSVVGSTLRDARLALESSGFRVRVQRVDSENPRGNVLEQSPNATDEAAPKSLVVLTVSNGPEAAEHVVVPQVVGLEASEAARLLRNAGLERRVSKVRSSQPAGTVLEQAPAADMEVSAKSVVRLQVSLGAPTPKPVVIEVPDVVGLIAADARRELRESGLRWTVLEVASNEAKGTVVGQSPRAGAELRKGEAITLRVSTGPAMVDVPDVVGLDEESARGKLETAGLDVSIVDETTTDPSEDGVVVSQSPTGSATVRKGAVVTLTIGRLG